MIDEVVPKPKGTVEALNLYNFVKDCWCEAAHTSSEPLCLPLLYIECENSDEDVLDILEKGWGC